VDPTVACNVLLLLHVPPVVVLVNVVDAPRHTNVVPDITAGSGFTVSCIVCKQPFDNVYVIVGIPAATPVTTPDEEPTVASAGLPLVHVPPNTEFSKDAVAPTHTFAVPVIVAGEMFTITG